MSKTVHLSLLPKRNHSYYQNESSHNELTGTHNGVGGKNPVNFLNFLELLQFNESLKSTSVEGAEHIMSFLQSM